MKFPEFQCKQADIHAYLQLTKKVTFEAFSLSRYALSPKMLQLLETVLKLLLFNSFQGVIIFFFNVFNILKSLSL